MERLPNLIPEADDGYTVTRYIAGRDNMYGSLRFTYRPVSFRTRQKFIDATTRLSNEDMLDRMSALAAKHLVSWNAIDHKGQPVDHTWQIVRQLHPEVGTRLFSIIVYANEGGDLDPESQSSRSDDEFAPPVDDIDVGEKQKN